MSGISVLYVFLVNRSIPPQKPFLLPNIIPKPIAQNIMVPITKSIRFLKRMFVEFLERVKPASTSANPACIKNTRDAVIRTQIVLIENA